MRCDRRIGAHDSCNHELGVCNTNALDCVDTVKAYHRGV